MSIEWVRAFMPLITGLAVSVAGFWIAKWYDRRKETRRIKDDLILDLTNLERTFFQLGVDWNKWVEILIFLQETGNEHDEMELQEEKIQYTFTDFKVQLNRLYGKLRIYLEWPVAKDLLRQPTKEGFEKLEVDPMLIAFGTLIRMSSKMQKSIDTHKLLIKLGEGIKQDFLEMAIILGSFYSEILSRKVKI